MTHADKRIKIVLLSSTTNYADKRIKIVLLSSTTNYADKRIKTFWRGKKPSE